MSQENINAVTDPPTDAAQPISRRALMQSAAALVATQVVGDVSANTGATAPAAAPKGPSVGSGVAGDFAFLTGKWKIANRRRKSPGVDEWDVFPGEATVWSILGGIGSIEELRIPARDFSGMGLRLLDVEKRVWIDHWVNAKNSVMTVPGAIGQFADGAGVFRSDWVDAKGQTMLARSVWDRITPTTCRWYQQSSKDGKVWDDEWLMDWVRVG